ncbi:MAG: HAD family hydrolase [Chloroflexi bacterium]|nr:HAD family hydrolase [Chloroflexota bacterium]
MIEVDIPRAGKYLLRHAVLDVNGTIACDGRIRPKVAQRLQVLRSYMSVSLLTADTHGRQASIDAQLGFQAVRLKGAIPEDEEKASFVRALGAGETVAIGNGANDAMMLKEAALGIAVLGKEGLAFSTLQGCDIVVSDVVDALDLLLVPKRLLATLRR